MSRHQAFYKHIQEKLYNYFKKVISSLTLKIHYKCIETIYVYKIHQVCQPCNACECMYEVEYKNED
jgi:hypothetical protein